ncbi:MAG: hypothetical protein HOP10_15895 [Chitinophagaceae bacterium]|nr:hypothetical protein [Chitinophagaceae bacterium]
MKKIKIFYCFIAVFFLFPVTSTAQDSLSGSYTDISRIGLVKYMGAYVSSAYINKKEDLPSVFQKLNFTPGIKHKGTIPPDLVTKKAVLKFNISNTADTAVSLYFLPGIYFENAVLYKEENNSLRKIPDIHPSITDSIGYWLITLQSHDSATIFAELSLVKTYIVTIRPRLIHPQYLDSFIAEIKSTHNQDNLLTYVFCGLLLMMILFSIANFFQGANRDFLYYSGYAFFIGCMLLTKAVFDFRINAASFFFESYFDFILQGIGIIFYMIFMQRFLDTRNKHPFLHTLYKVGIGMLTISLLFYTWLHYFSSNFALEYLVENTSKMLLLVMIVIFLVYSAKRWKDKLLRFLFWGNLFMLIFSVISLLAVMMENMFQQLPGIFNSSLFYYEAGLFFELVFFLAGLNYKNRRIIIMQTREREMLKTQNQMQEYEKELAVYKAQQEERQRISADMHDELGSGMTAIRLMSEIARNKMKENTPVEIEKISHSANDVLNKMNAIIWSMNSGNDTLDNLVSYIRSYALEYFENTPILCKVNMPENIPPLEISGDKRRNIFLCVKETLNNAWKHSEASVITIDFHLNHVLVITITDNGKGIDMLQLRQFGNGLKNIAHRMESIGGSFKIERKDGAVTTLELPV